jgi:hypothetical protein
MAFRRFLNLKRAAKGDQETEKAMRDAIGKTRRWATVLATVTAVATANAPAANADEANAKQLLKSMSDYLAKEKAISFEFDSTLEVVTKDAQKLGLASSGRVTINRPDKIHATRKGGFANVELTFDGKTVTLLGKNANAYAQVDSPGTIDQLVDTLRDKYGRPIPAGDLLMSDVYNQLMQEVTDTKDLGSGVIEGVECDHLAFRTEQADWQIWIAQGARPYPCRYTITSTKVSGGPQYSVDVHSWRTGADVVTDPFKLQIPAGAKKMNPSDLPDFDELPGIFAAKKGT